MNRLTIPGLLVLALLAAVGPVRSQSTTWHDGAFTASDGRTLLYRYWIRSDWNLTAPRPAVVYFHGNNRGTAEQARQASVAMIDTALELGLAFVVPASPWSTPEELSDGERSLMPETVGAGGTRFWAADDARLVHEFLQSNIESRVVLDHDRIVFAGASQGTCFLAKFLESHGSLYGGGVHAHCGCFWLDFDGNDSHDTHAIAPPFHSACSYGDLTREEIYDWLSSGTVGPHPRSGNDTDGDGTPDQTDLDDDGDGIGDGLDDDDTGRGLAFVSRNRPVSGYNGTFIQARAQVHSRRSADVGYPAVSSEASYQYLELGDAEGRFEIMVDSFTRRDSCPSVLLPQLCDVEQFAASGYYSSYYQVTGPNGDRWIHGNRQNVTASTRSDTSAFECADES